MRLDWRRWLQPSLVRRLVLAQMATAALLWIALIGFMQWQITRDGSLSDEGLSRQGAALVLPLVEALQGQPELLSATLQRLDGFQRAFMAPVDQQSQFRLPSLFVWRDGAPIYRSADAPFEPELTRVGLLSEQQVDGLRWHVYVQDSADRRSRLAVLMPTGPEALGMKLWSWGWFVLPLLVSLPLLVAPACLSVRLALRPWARVTHEIATRGPADLSPLSFTSRHRELSPLSQAVDALMARVRTARERERCFIADAAHELRTPIAAMRINAEALQLHGLAPRERELLDGLLASNDRAGRLVMQLLALTRSEAAPDTATSGRVDLERLVQDSLAQLAPLARAREVELELDVEPGLRVRGDAESLHSLVDNLVGNAIKYSPVGGVVRVRATRHADAVELSVSDDGPGIAPELRERVLDRFYRVPGQAEPGSGLGLAIVKAVAERHGARLELASGPRSSGLRVSLVFGSDLR